MHLSKARGIIFYLGTEFQNVGILGDKKLAISLKTIVSAKLYWVSVGLLQLKKVKKTKNVTVSKFFLIVKQKKHGSNSITSISIFISHKGMTSSVLYCNHHYSLSSLTGSVPAGLPNGLPGLLLLHWHLHLPVEVPFSYVGGGDGSLYSG